MKNVIELEMIGNDYRTKPATDVKAKLEFPITAFIEDFKSGKAPRSEFVDVHKETEDFYWNFCEN